MKTQKPVQAPLLLLFVFTALTAMVPNSAKAQSSIDWLQAIHYAQLVQIAENVAPTSSYTDDVIELIQAQGYTFLHPIYGSDLGTDATPATGATVSYGFLAVSASGELVAVIRGTDTILEWIDDAEFPFVSDPVNHGKGLTEDGFTTIYKSLRLSPSTSSETVVNAVAGYVNSGTAKSVTITGHSLGGALSTLLALDVALNTAQNSPVLYTYASPRVGDEYLFVPDFNSKVPTSYRVYNNTDVVPDIPFWPYGQVKTPFELISDSNEVDTGIACSHHLTTYLWLMGQEADVDAGPLDADCVPSN